MDSHHNIHLIIWRSPSVSSKTQSAIVLLCKHKHYIYLNWTFYSKFHLQHLSNALPSLLEYVLDISCNCSMWRYVILWSPCFHQHFKTFIFNDTKWPHAPQNPFDDFSSSLISRKRLQEWIWTIPCLRPCVLTIWVSDLAFPCSFKYCRNFSIN